MSEFDQIGQQLHQARADRQSIQRQLFESEERIKQLKAEQARLGRTLDPNDREGQRRLAELEQKIASAQGAAEEARAALKEHLSVERSALERFGAFSDPRKYITNLNDQYPILLLPLRIETRWRLQERQLWVRVYPDDCSVDSFEPTLSEAEVKNAQRFWSGMWAAGGVEDQQRAAWRGLVASHGTGRAAWMFQQYRPLDSPPEPKDDPSDVILVIPTAQPDPAEKTQLVKYWIAVWLADEDASKTAAARAALVGDVGEARAQALIEQFKPTNLGEKPQGKLKSEVKVSVEFLHFPPVDETAAKRNSWSQPAKVNIMPDRLVLMGYQGDALVIDELGNPIPSPLVLTPDPSAAPEDQLRAENGDLIVSEDMRWMVDFERAIAVGMGFKIELGSWTEDQWQHGLDRLIVLGIRLSADPYNGKELLQTLIQDQHYSPNDFSMVPQGTPTNNTEKGGAGFSQSQDADETFDNYVLNNIFFKVETDWSLKRDGQWLAECLGIDYSALNNIPHADGTDQLEALAMNTALFPATLGYMLRTLLKPGLGWDQVDQVRWFFRHFVSGRGQIPAIRIGNQPYGILPATVYSRMRWFASDAVPTPNVGTRVSSSRTLLSEINNVINKLHVFWDRMAQEVPYVGKQPGDAHQILLSIIGLHPLSVEYHSRVAQSEAHLYNQQAFLGQAVQFVTTFQKLVSAGNEIAGEDVTLSVLRMLGYQAPETPDLLTLIFNRHAQQLKGPVVDDRPLSETDLIRAYAIPISAGGAQRNYLQWLVDAANTSLEALRIQSGFLEDKAPTALLYLVLRYSLMQGYWKTGIEFHRAATLTHVFDVERVRAEPRFIHVQQQNQVSESRFAHLYVPLAGVTNPDDVNDTLSTAIPRLLQQEGWSQTENLREEIRAVQSLVNVPTARLERLFAEHIDICSYRLDAWQQALVRYQLAAMRSRHYNPQNAKPGGVYLGMYGWLEQVRSENKVLTPVELPDDLRKVFDPPREDQPPPQPIMRDSQNGGYIHAPSLNHAVTAAVLRNGYTSATSDEKQKPLAVNLSSERVRLALSFIEGIRGGQSLGALLGYQLERGLHDRGGFVEVDQFMYQLRKAFPLQANKLKLPVDPTTGAADPDTASIEAQEARNVVDGLALVNHVNQQTGANRLYPFGKDLLRGSTLQEQAINQEVTRLLDIHDALADLALAEGVHQVVQGNYDRAAATLDTYSRGNFPPIPDVIQTPRSGITLVHRVAVHLEAGGSWNSSPIGAIAITPRSAGEPAINRWLASLLPAQPADVVCKVLITDPTTHTESPFHVSWKDLQLQPLDLLYLIQPENQQAMAELDDRILRHIITNQSPRPDAKIEIKYTDRVSNKFTFFELVPLMLSLRSLILSSRPLQSTDVMLSDEARQSQDQQVVGDKTRLDQVQTRLDQLQKDVSAAASAFTSQLDDLTALQDEQASLEAERPTATAARVIEIDTRLSAITTERDAWLDNIDTWTASTIELLVRASSFGIAQTGWGFAYSWKAVRFGEVLTQVAELIKRWDDHLTEFDLLMSQYAALPTTIPDDERIRFLLRAETLLSMQATDPVPATPSALRTIVLGKRLAFSNKQSQFEALLSTSTASLSVLLNNLKALLPIDAFDKTPFDVSSTARKIVTFVGDMQRLLQGVAADAENRLKEAQVHITAFAATANAKAKAELLKKAAVALLGEGFPFTPEFKLLPEQGTEWEQAYNAGKNGDLLKYQVDQLKTEFPVDDWLYGLARVRQKLRDWEQVVMLAGAFNRIEPELLPIQLPYREGDSWLALQYPDDPAFVVDGERLLYTAYYPTTFDKTASQCGLLLDEWTEVLPMENETTGIAFHYDRPSSEPPQVMLLVTPPAFTGSWQWQDVVDTLHETLALARQRTVEPAQVDATPLNRLLPATLMALTLREVSISGNLAINNKALEIVRRSES
jgi:hypothetical protein